MALIECSECGKMISDKASACPHCGCPVEKKLTCEECGQQLSANDTVCPYCGCPINETTTECEITNNNDIEDKTCKQGRRINVTRIVQIVLVCLLVSGGGYWLLSDRTVKGNDNELAADNALAADIDPSAIRYEEEIRRQIRQEEEKQRNKKEEERRRLEEEKRRRGPDWIQGTWVYSAYNSRVTVVIHGDGTLTTYFNGKKDYDGTYEIRDNGNLYYDIYNGMCNYLILDYDRKILKVDRTHDFQKVSSY